MLGRCCVVCSTSVYVTVPNQHLERHLLTLQRPSLWHLFISLLHHCIQRAGLTSHQRIHSSRMHLIELSSSSEVYNLYSVKGWFTGTLFSAAVVLLLWVYESVYVCVVNPTLYQHAPFHQGRSLSPTVKLFISKPDSSNQHAQRHAGRLCQ